MGSIFDSPEKQIQEAEERERGKIFQKRFKPPKGWPGGSFIGSIVTSMAEWRLATHKDKSPISHQQFIDEQLDIATRIEPAVELVAAETPESIKQEEARKRKGVAEIPEFIEPKTPEFIKLEEEQVRRRVRQSRRRRVKKKTVITGALIPEVVGKKTLLG